VFIPLTFCISDKQIEKERFRAMLFMVDMKTLICKACSTYDGIQMTSKEFVNKT